MIKTEYNPDSREKELFEMISTVPHFKQSQYGSLNIAQTFGYIRKRYIDPIRYHLDIAGLTLMDCGAGYGWISFSFLRHGGSRATLCDIDSERLDAAREIATILGLAERCEFICCPMQKLKLRENCVDIFASVETLEHVQEENIDTCIKLIASATKRLVILTTPNKLFPVVWHDTKTPFAHWLPRGIRKRYVRLFGKEDEYTNDFVSPLRLGPIRGKFKSSSVVLTFPSYRYWKNSYPFQSPYGRIQSERWRSCPPILLKMAYFLLDLFIGRHSYFLSPNLCRIWVRRNENSQ